MNPMNIIDIQNMVVEEEMDLWVKLLLVEYEAVSFRLETSLYLVFTKMSVDDAEKVMDPLMWGRGVRVQRWRKYEQ